MPRVAMVLALAFVCSACTRLGLGSTSPLPKPVDPVTGVKTLPKIVLGEGDVVDIKVYREPDLAGVYRVSTHGEIQFPLIGNVKIGGRDAFDVGEDIRERLADGFLKNPQVMVFVREYNSQKIHVLGEVAKDGSFGYERGMTIIQALTNAGGLTQLAAPNKIRVTRVVDGVEQKYELPVGEIRAGNAPNFELQPGDIVFVPEAIF